MFVELGRDVDHLASDPSIATTAALGATRYLERPRWNAAIKLYNRDEVADAFELIKNLGAGDRGQFAQSLLIIEAEMNTSKSSLITRYNDSIEVELIPDQQNFSAQEIGEVADEAIRYVWAKIGLRPEVNTLITLLSKETVLPGQVDATGYVTIKKPYAKYCLPALVGVDLERLRLQVQMLAACHAAAILSGSDAPLWLICATEAFSQFVVGNDIRYKFCSGQIKWREPKNLSIQLNGHQSELDPVQSAIDALDQANLIGHYLIEKFGVKIFRDCLSYHSPNSLFQYFVLLFSNDPTRDACKKVFGFAPEYLFEQALATCCK